MRFLSLILFLSSTVLLSGCMRLSDGTPPGPWHEAYQPINDPESEAFVSQSLDRAIAEFGKPAVPVEKVLLRRSRKIPEARRYRIAEDFSLTECVDSTNGVFVIYLAVDPGHRNYFPLLGHECAHLLNPYIFDWYMEGLATLFSEQMCEETEREWGDWQRHFERTRREPYGLSYRMMRELQQEFPDEYPAIIRFTAENGSGKGRRHIDIDAWLATLPPARRTVALDIIFGYADVLRKKASEQYYFSTPESL
ncbi:MAG: hypothetical protein DRP64_16000 [Verrucomicrobia bacterium]|nr:MAG: hypothetical protein DRP64_16000 [Verrucomicrobiota bacterium]